MARPHRPATARLTLAEKRARLAEVLDGPDFRHLSNHDLALVTGLDHSTVRRAKDQREIPRQPRNRRRTPDDLRLLRLLADRYGTREQLDAVAPGGG